MLLTAKTVWCEAHVLTGRPIHSAPFEYVFGTQGRRPVRPGRRVVGEEP